VHKDFWEATRGILDQGLAYGFEEMGGGKTVGGKNVSTNSFIEGFSHLLGMFASAQDWQDIYDAGTDYTKVPHHLKRVLETAIGAAMYQGARVTVMRKLFSTKVVEELNKLQVDFSTDAIAEFLNDMRHLATQFVQAGAKEYEPMAAESPWCEVLCTITLTCPNDIWEFPMNSLFKTAAINNGSLEKTAWEAVCFPSKISGVASNLDVPLDRLAKAKSVRSQVAIWLGKKPLSITDQCKIIALHAKEIYKLERFFEYEIDFLMNHALPKCMKMLQEEVMARLPSGDEPVPPTPTQVVIMERYTTLLIILIIILI